MSFIRHLLAFVLLIQPVLAQDVMPVQRGRGAAPPSGYSGPGDVTTFAAFWAFRGYSGAAVTPGTLKSASIRRGTDNVTCDFLLKTTGDLGNTSATCNSSTEGNKTMAAFAGTDQTGNATSAGTAVALTGLAATIHAGDSITGAGFTSSYCVSVGAFAAGSQTCTTNTSQTIGVSEAVTLTNALFIVTFYDQTGGGFNVTQATAAQQPPVVLNCINSTLPCIAGVRASSLFLASSSTLTSTNMSLSAVVQRTGDLTVNSIILCQSTALDSLLFTTTSGQVAIRGNGTALTGSASNNAFHAIQGAVAAAAPNTTVLNVDGTETTGTTDVPGGSGAPCVLGNASVGKMTGLFAEGGMANANWNATIRGNLHTNQSAYYGTP